MGRSSAGGSGGGRSSSGSSFRSSGGHRSSGGGGRSSRGGGAGFRGSSGGNHRGSGSHSGGFHRGPDPFGGFGPMGGLGHYGGMWMFGRPRPRPQPWHYGYQSGCGTVVLLVLVVIVLFFSSAWFLGGSSLGGSSNRDDGIQASSLEREKLPDSMTKETAYYQDDLGWIGNSHKLEKGMKYFYQTTGVFPYLWITDNVDGDDWPSDEKIDEKLDAMYTECFADEGHAIVMYLDAGGGRYITRCLQGASAKTVLDAEATEILLDYLDAYATSDMDDETYFSTCFTKAADRMMSHTTNSSDVARTLILAVAAVALAIAVIAFLIRRRQLKLEQTKADQEILNTKL